MQGIINSGNKKRNDFLRAVQLPFYPVIGPGVSSMMLQEKADGKYDYMNMAKMSGIIRRINLLSLIRVSINFLKRLKRMRLI